VGGLLFFFWLVARSRRNRKNNKESAVQQPPAVETQPKDDENSEPPPAEATVNPDRYKTFLSYRRSESGDITGRIYDRLAQHFGEENIFKDVDSIPLGVDFKQHLQTAVAQCDFFLAVIGRNWLGPELSDASPSIHDATDFVRIEIEGALERGIPVIPLFVQNASTPNESELPDSLKPLVYKNGLPVRPDPDFHNDMNRLIRAMENQAAAD
jgi:hypothetical protein